MFGIKNPMQNTKRLFSSNYCFCPCFRPHKHKHRSKRLGSKAEHMDYLVAVNVDQFLLDCLEEELPCVTFPPEVPGSSPLELIENFHTCTSMRHSKGNYTCECCMFESSR